MNTTAQCPEEDDKKQMTRDEFVHHMMWSPAWLGLHLIDWGSVWDKSMATDEEDDQPDQDWSDLEAALEAGFVQSRI